MKFGEMFPSNFLKKEDLMGPTTVKITKVDVQEIKGEHGNEQKAVLHFSSGLKPMVLNKGNGICLMEAYGDESDGWIGKAVEIYVDPNVMYGGKRVGGLRLKIPQNNGHVNPAVLSWPDAVKRAWEVGINEADLKAALKARGLTGTSDSRLTSTVLEIISEKKVERGDSFEGASQGSAYNDIPFAWLVPMLLPLVGMMT